MMDIEEYRKLSINAGLPLQFVIKEFAMFELLAKLAGEIGYPLVGGTAINRIYLNELGRFSEDLDFEVYGKRKITLPEIEGFKLSGPFVYRRNVRFEYAFGTVLGKDKIRLDFNIKPKTYIKVENMAIRFVSGAAISGVKTLSLEGLIARKILALKRRIEGKDIYDLWMSRNLLDKNKLLYELARILRTEKINENKDDFLRGIIEKVENSDVREFSKTNQYIPTDKRIDWKIGKADVLGFLRGLTRNYK